jgi:glycerate-2-kinase
MIFTHEHFLTYSIREFELGHKIANILAASINAVDPYSAINKNVSREGKNITVGSKIYRLNEYKNIYVVGAGKAGFPMASGIQDLLRRLFNWGIIIIKEEVFS